MPSNLSRLKQGSYLLLLHLPDQRTVVVGRLGQIDFAPGFYAYTGSALGPGGLAARLRHHLAASARPHWHLDYLRPFARPREVLYCENHVRLEHHWARMLSECRRHAQGIPGFGCSDCRCPSHLFHFNRQPDLRHLIEAAQRHLAAAPKLQHLVFEHHPPLSQGPPS